MFKNILRWWLQTDYPRCSRSVYRNAINTEVSAVVMLHHLALLADHANGRIRRERVFRDHNDLLVGYIKICNFMSDHFFFNSGTVRSLLLTEFTAAATCCHSLCFLLLAIPIPWPPNKTTFRASISPRSVSTSASVKFRFFVFLSTSAVVSDKT